MFRSLPLAAASAATLAIALPASAQFATLLDANFDDAFPQGAFTYSYQQFGSVPVSPTGAEIGPVFDPDLDPTPEEFFDNTFGVGGTAAHRVTADFTNASGVFAGFGGGLLGLFDEPDDLPPFGDVVPSGPEDIDYSFDLAVEGAIAADVGSNLTLNFNAPDDTLSPADPDTDNDLLASFILNPLTPRTPGDGSFQTYSGTLADWTLDEGSFANLQTFIDDVIVISLNFNFGSPFNDFGNDADNAFILDNVLLTSGEETVGLPGDANNDGTVDLADFGILRSEFGMGGGMLLADFNDDGTVDLADFGILRANFGSTADLGALDAWYASVVPEPATVGLLALGGLALVRRRRA